MNQDESPVEAIERLCHHHDVDSFACQDHPDYVIWLRNYWERSKHPYGDRVLAAIDDGAVVGYISSMDVVLDHPVFDGLYFFVPAVAVSDAYRGSGVFAALCQNLLASKDKVFGRSEGDYRGIMAQPGSNGALIRGLLRLGFRRLDQSEYWIRLDDTED